MTWKNGDFAKCTKAEASNQGAGIKEARGPGGHYLSKFWWYKKENRNRNKQSVLEVAPQIFGPSGVTEQESKSSKKIQIKGNERRDLPPNHNSNGAKRHNPDLLDYRFHLQLQFKSENSVFSTPLIDFRATNILHLYFQCLCSFMF